METKPSSRLVTALEELSGNVAQTVAFGTEGPFLNEMGCESVIFGPGNIATAHQPNEHVEIEISFEISGEIHVSRQSPKRSAYWWGGTHEMPAISVG